MQTILVPTDFSNNAFLAAQYAASLARETGRRVQLYHVYIVLYSGFGEKGVSVNHIEWAGQEAKKEMDRLVATLAEQYPDVAIEGECVRGFMIDALRGKLKREKDIGLMVMGTKGVTNVAESVFGSTTYEVLKKSPVPVLVIPGDTPDFSLKHVGFFSDFNDHEWEALTQMKTLLSPLETFEIIHFVKEGARPAAEQRQDWIRKVVEGFPGRHIDIEEIEVEKVDINSVAAVAKERNLDLMVFTRPQKPFFEKIFGTSLTKSVANYPVIPSLFIKG